MQYACGVGGAFASENSVSLCALCVKIKIKHCSIEVSFRVVHLLKELGGGWLGAK